jgi:DNA repair protein RecN (Recombination protein N)
VLSELRLDNYAVIDNVAVEFAPGLNLLTGETGAGKSILIDALALLLGEKACADVIRAGAERAVVSAVFDVESGVAAAIATLLENNGIDRQEDSVILRREIAAGGKSRAFVNNQPATLAVLKQLAPHLAGIHAQNQSLLSFDAAARLALLDAFAGTQAEETAGAFLKWKRLAARIYELENDEQDRLRLLDLWSFQKREIEQARLEAGEDERLQTEKRILANAEKIHSAATHAFDLLYEGDASTAASLRAAQKHIEELARYEPKFQEALSALESARISIEDVGAGLRDFAGGIEASPERLAEVEERLALLDRLKRKYGPRLDDVVQHGVEVSSKLSDVENKDEVLGRLRIELAEAREQYLGAARAISKMRFQAAPKLEQLVESEINDLAMKVTFRIQLSGGDNNEEDWTASGFDQVAYMICTNPGEPLRRLEQIASGGELSRVMLALKATLERRSSQNRSQRTQRTLVFDEIDTGIGGRAAEAVGRKLKRLARSNQVLCVTHLPQIATFADQHYLIEKTDAGAKAHTSVRLITGKERTEEVARMLSGARLTESSRKHAEQMLKANA